MAKKLWGGRFSKRTDHLVEEFTRSVHYDYKLGEYDVMGSLYHVKILKRAKLISAKEAGILTKGLSAIEKSIKNGDFRVDPKAEDIHSVIQNALEKRIGKIALKLHTSRSRNDQVVFDVKMYCLDNIFKTLGISSDFIKGLSNTALKNGDIILPGYTHLQHAQPVPVIYYLGAYMEMIKRDNSRLRAIADSMALTFGSGAMAGTEIPASFYDISGLPFKKRLTAAENPIDSVSNRDFVMEIVSALSIMGMHLSRMSEDLILWSTKEFDFVELDDAFCTGSSLMPQKKNPDVLELVRGYTGRLYGNLISVLVMMKGLPLSYNRDMQLDKESLFDSFSIIQNSLKVITGVVSSITFNKKSIDKQLEDESLYATDLGHYLVSKGVAFREAHTIIGNLVRYSVDNRKNMRHMNNRELNRFSELLNSQIVNKIMNPKTSVRTKRSIRKTK